jgi:hypothetical protein
MNKFIKKLFGIEKLEKEKEEAVVRLAQATAREEAAKEAERITNLAPKERATARNESYIAVMDTKVNKDNPRNGFFELDWNEFFIQDLIKAGYGFESDPEEEIVDRWFRDIVRNMLSDEGLDTSRAAGFINVSKIGNNRAEAS